MANFGNMTDPVPGSGAISSIIRAKFQHIIEVLQKLTNWTVESAQVTLHPDVENKPGSIMLWPGYGVPVGYTLGDGLPRLRTQFPRIYANYIDPNSGADLWPGGNGVTTFGTPPLPGRMLIAAGQGSGLTLRALGQTPGAEVAALLASNNGIHKHPAQRIVFGGTTGNFTGSGPTPIQQLEDTGDTGQGLPFSIMPPGLVITFCLKM